MKTFDTLDEAYTELYPKLVSIARRHIFNQDYAQDAVQDAFVKALVYSKNNPKRKISGFIIARELMRSCRRINKKGSQDIPMDFSTTAITDMLEGV